MLIKICSLLITKFEVNNLCFVVKSGIIALVLVIESLGYTNSRTLCKGIAFCVTKCSLFSQITQKSDSYLLLFRLETNLYSYEKIIAIKLSPIKRLIYVYFIAY